MEFDSPEVAREFPGLYANPDGQKEMNDPVDYDDELDKKKKKDKKDSKKDKGYATLADENSQEEEDGDDSNHAKKKLKGFKLSGKKKEKDKELKDKDVKKEKKLDKEKKKGSDTERKSADREIPFSNVRIPFSAERHRDVAHRSSVPTAFFTSTPKSSKDKPETRESGSPVAQVEKERSSSFGLNAFLNAPAPLFLQKKKAKEKDKEVKKEKAHKKDLKDAEKKGDKVKKDKEHKDKKEHASGVAKVKLKLMRSKNSLDDPHEKGELHVSVSRQFPEDPDALTKEIRKHELLLEQTHTSMKSSKKVSKKQEEQLWELQRTLTALKRKLRSINALSTASMNHHHVAAPSSSSSGILQKQHGSESAEESTEKSSPTNNSIPPPSSISPVAVNGAIYNSNNHMEKQGCETEQEHATNESTIPVVLPIGLGCAPSVSNDETLGQIEANDQSMKQLRDKHEQTISTIVAPASVVRKSARRSLDFSDIVVEKKQPLKSNDSGIPNCCSQEICVDDDRKAHHLESESVIRPEETPGMHVEHEKVEVHVIVHQESKEDDDDVINEDGDSSVARSEDEDEALPSVSSRTEENIVNVVHDANAMIGSMHEELEAAARVFGHVPKSSRVKFRKAAVSKSEPTFGEQVNDSSDVELIRDDDEESFIDELIPELMCLPEFETPEYISYENEQLGLFNKAIQDEIMKEEAELDIMIEELDNIRSANDTQKRTDDNSDECDMEKLVAVWKSVKASNEALHANVSHLRQLVAFNRLDEFKLETRLRFLEDKMIPISPITITTPLPSETV